MDKNYNKKILKIEFVGHNVPWAYKIHAGLNKEQKKEYFATDLPSIIRSISQKRYNLTILTSLIREEMESINIELKKRQKDVEECIEKNHVYRPTDRTRIIKILSFCESVFFTLKSLSELLYKYTEKFYKVVLKKNKNVLEKDFENKNIEKKSIEELINIRDELIHNQAARLFFQKTNNHFTFGLELLNNLHKNKDRTNNLTTEKLDRYLEKFHILYDKIWKLLLEKIEETKQL